MDIAMLKKHRAYESFLRRFALSYYAHDLMLKGSFLTHQIFPERIPADLDFVCLKRFDTKEKMAGFISNCLKEIIQIDIQDGIEFKLLEYDYTTWTHDYMVSDDFPTMSEGLHAIVDGEEIFIGFDFSFNLQLFDEPIEIEYQPYTGESFLIAKTTSVETQIAWKLHQTMVNPRHKDILDLTYLLKHTSYIANEDARRVTYQTLENECARDGLDIADALNPHDVKNILKRSRKILEKDWQTVELPIDSSLVKPQSFHDFWNCFIQALLASGLLNEW